MDSGSNCGFPLSQPDHRKIYRWNKSDDRQSPTGTLEGTGRGYPDRARRASVREVEG